MKKNKVLCLIAAILFCGTVITFMPGLVSKANAAEDGLVLHLKFDNDTTDSSGNSNNGTGYGDITYEEGVLGNAAVFDGSSYVEVKDSDTLDLQNNFTISLWANKKYSGGKFVPYVWKEKNPSTTFGPYQLYDHWRNCPNLFLHGSGINQFGLSGTMLDICEWNLITVTYDGSEACMYYNGKLVIKKLATGTLNETTGNLNIGIHSDKKIYFNGKMDDLRIYSRAMSAQEIKDLYDAGYASNPTLLEKKEEIVAHYEFEDNYEDSSDYMNNGELLSESDSVAFVPAIVGKGLRLGDGSYIEVPDHTSLNLDKGFSITTWMLRDAGDTMPILHRLTPGLTSNPNSMDYGIYLLENKIDYNYQPFIDNHSFISSRLISKTNFTGVWTHLTLTSDGKELRWYIDGKLAKKETSQKLEVSNANGALMIGTDGKKFFSGVLDDLTIYNYPLTADEVKKEYNQQDTLSISKDNKTKLDALKAKSSLTLTVNRNYVETGDSVQIEKDIIFTSSNSKIFKVSKAGKITAVKKGSATLTIKHGGISKSYKVKVK